MSAVLCPQVGLNQVFPVSPEGTTAASELFLLTVNVRVSVEVAAGVGAVGTVGTGKRLLACVSAHVFLQVIDIIAGVGTVGAIVHLPVVVILAYCCTSFPAALHHLLGMLSLLICCQTPTTASLTHQS